jgi:cytochrome c2
MAGVQAHQCASASAACTGLPGCRPALTADMQPQQARGGDAQARLALRQYACIACHRVPGVVGPDTHVGPPLQDFARREVLPGGLPNTQENLVRWLLAPHNLHPGTAMPDMGLTEHHARLIATYLLTAN